MTGLRKNKIAVISADSAFSDFFAWEARACGCLVEVFLEPPSSLMGFDLVVLDLRVGLCLPDDPRCRLAVVISDGRDGAYPMADFVWEMPVDVEMVRDAYVQVERRTEDALSEERAPREAAIYAISERERTVLYQNRTVALTESEWRILTRLGEQQGSVVSKEALAEMLESAVGNAVNVHVCHLRQKLEAPFGVRVLETVRGGGYRLKVALKRWEG